MGSCYSDSKVDKGDAHEAIVEQSQADPKEVYEEIVKLRPSFRGFSEGATFYDETAGNYNHQVIQNLTKFASIHLKKRLQNLAPYSYDLSADIQDPLFENRLFKPTCHMLDDQGVYIGEW